jgi:ketosteroid isomerase-like protein
VESANLNLVRSIYAEWERGDFRSVAWAHPAIEWEFADGPAPGRWTEPATLADVWRDFVSAWDDFRIVADEYRELDGERVLVLDHFSGRGKASGLEVGQMRAKGVIVFHVRDARVTRLVRYWDRERALADLGAAPEGGSTAA